VNRTIASPKVTRSMRNFTTSRRAPPASRPRRLLSPRAVETRIVPLMPPSPFDLRDRVAVVIGATSGIGKSIALGLADAGADVVPTGRRTDLVKAAVSEVEERGRRSLAVPADVSDDGSIRDLEDAVIKQF